MANLSQVILRGTHAARPTDNTAATAGRLYYETDTFLLFRDSGSGWDSYSTSAVGDVVGPGSSVDDRIVTFDGTTGALIQDSGVSITALHSLYPANGRLTLESGVAVSTTDQADKTTLYYTPYQGNCIALYDGSKWVLRTFSELSLNISAYTASKPYDIWAYDNAGTVALDSTVWTDGTTRATALSSQDGVLCKTGALTRRYLGTIYMDAASKCQDTVLHRYVWNNYNRKARKLLAIDTTDSWTYTTATWRSANNSTANRVDIVIGVVGDVLDLDVSTLSANSTAATVRASGIGVDSTSTNSADLKMYNVGAANYIVNINSKYSGAPSVGYHYYQWLEYSVAGGTCTWYGDAGAATIAQAGMIGEVWA